MSDEPVKGYKAFDADLKCRGMQYEVGGTFEHDGPLEVCGSGLHFCAKCGDVFDYYEFDPEGTRVCEVEALGNVKTDGNKSCTDRLKVVRELSWPELLEAANSGSGNSGNCNSGNCNSGNCNSGNCNSGNWNSGDRNSGNCNSGNWNSGNWNSGDWNSGDRNSGNWNSGDWNSGDWNSGNWNSGDWNSGNWNSGDWNSGHRNSGNCNSGDWNATNYSSGVLCTEEPECLVFDRPSGMTLREWRTSEAAEIMSRIEVPHPTWRSWNDLDDRERELNSRFECQGGMLVTPEGCGEPDFEGWWARLTEDERRVIFAIPNFDAAKWERITGLDVRAELAAAR